MSVKHLPSLFVLHSRLSSIPSIVVSTCGADGNVNPNAVKSCSSLSFACALWSSEVYALLAEFQPVPRAASAVGSNHPSMLGSAATNQGLASVNMPALYWISIGPSA